MPETRTTALIQTRTPTANEPAGQPELAGVPSRGMRGIDVWPSNGVDVDALADAGKATRMVRAVAATNNASIFGRKGPRCT